MSEYWKKLDHIPDLDKKYHLGLSDILLLPLLSPTELWQPPGGYGSFLCTNDELVSELQQYFTNRIDVRYQVILGGLPPHTDFTVRPWKYNYTYDLGGPDAVTRWHDGETVLDEVKRNPGWYYLNVHVEHSITGVTSPRLSITVREDLE